MITSATIENFKGFKKLELPDLSRITLLGGKNNVGKTSVLEAIFLCHGRGNSDILLPYLTWRGTPATSRELEALPAAMFRNYDTKHKITISLLEDGVEKILSVELNRSHSPKSIKIELPRPAERITPLATDVMSFPSFAFDIIYKQDQKQQKSTLEVRFLPDSTQVDWELVSSQFESLQITPPHIVFLPGKTESISASETFQFSQLDIEGRQNAVVDFLKILEARLVDLSLITIGKQAFIYGDIGIGRKIPVAHMGQGINQLLSLILAISTTRNGVVLIDEFENGIHHSVMAKIWEAVARAACQFNCQIMATTHSYECLQAAHDGVAKAGLADDFRYVRLDREGEDTVAKTYSYDMLGAALEREWEVR